MSTWNLLILSWQHGQRVCLSWWDFVNVQPLLQNQKSQNWLNEKQITFTTSSCKSSREICYSTFDDHEFWWNTKQVCSCKQPNTRQQRNLTCCHRRYELYQNRTLMKYFLKPNFVLIVVCYVSHFLSQYNILFVNVCIALWTTT